MKTYKAIEHYAPRRAPFKNRVQFVHSEDGTPLPHRSTPPSRSRYAPHVGKKQLAKLTS